jgi:hypothetical protein
VCPLVPPYTQPIPGADAIAELHSIRLGGFEQTVLLRGNDRRNPILLYVHGGPGASQMPIAPTYSHELEKHSLLRIGISEAQAHRAQALTGTHCLSIRM